MHVLITALIVADGDVPPRSMIDRLLGRLATEALLVVAADGGALKAQALGLLPSVVVGDLDSLADEDVARLRAAGAQVIVHSPAKDESDTELALRAAIEHGAQRIVIVAGFGGKRLEHTLANVLLLGSPEFATIDVSLADGRTTVRVLRGPGQLDVSGATGDYVSLLPLTELVGGVTTNGLAFPLSAAELRLGPSRGLSNELESERATVAASSGVLAVIHTVRTEDLT